MKQNEYENAMRALVFTFLAAPATILIGMFVVGAIIDSFLHQTQNTFSLIFLGVGGIPGVIAYYVREWKQYNNRCEQMHILRVRLAKGEINAVEFKKIREQINE